MEPKKVKKRKRSSTKITPPKKKKMENLSRDEVRSINKKRIKRKRKAKRLAMLFLLAVAVLSVGVVLVLSVFFKINTITIKGDKVYSNKEIIQNCGISVGDNLFRISEKTLNEKLPEVLPYVENVTLERKLPDTLIVNISATREIAALPNGTGFALIDYRGKVLDKNASMLREGVAMVSGVTPKDLTEGKTIVLKNQKLTDDFITLLGAIKESKMNLLTEIKVSKSGGFQLNYDDRIRIELGGVENIVVKLQRAKAAIEKENQINAYAEGTLDLKTEPYAYFSPGEEEETKPQKNTSKKKGN